MTFDRLTESIIWMGSPLGAPGVKQFWIGTVWIGTDWIGTVWIGADSIGKVSILN